jgi:hypothetical protein
LGALTLATKYLRSDHALIQMKPLVLLVAFLCLLQASSGKDVAVADTFIISLPDTAKEQSRSQQSDNVPDTILRKYSAASFQLSTYRWPNVKPDVPLNQIPEQWKNNKEWASVSSISEGKTDSGILYVTFRTRIVRDGRPPFDSEMTVLRASTGEAFMFQMTGDAKAIDAIRKSIRNK